ncbi:MAG TPA: HEPN domain-containing protein [Pyrinomonadaceae bacterium]|nr:HEPN domain-containing protein [Pyrinomonadaceae bacterium]
MKSETAEWIDKAEGDWGTMLRESEVLIHPNYDAVCFHAQQCVEKYLKGRLIEADVPFRKTHDLLNLLEALSHVEPDWKTYHQILSKLSIYGVAGRYPGLLSNQTQSKEAVEICREIRDIVRKSLGLFAA